MARLYTIEEIPLPAKSNWQHILRVRMNETSIPNYGELDRWTRLNFRRNYVLIASMSQFMAGGSTNNEIHCPDRAISIDYYELRCDNDDASAFLKRWVIPKKEYQQNLDYYQERENMRQGWCKVDDVPVGTFEVINLARKAPGGALKKLLKRYARS